MTKNTSIILIAVVAAVMMVGALAVTVTTGDAFAAHFGQNANGENGVNHGNNGHENDGDGGASGGVAACHNRCGARA